MAKTKQFTIAVENQPSAVAEIARTFGNAKVNILALLATALVPAVSVEDHVARCSVLGKSLSQLLRDPRTCRMLRGIKVEDSPPVVADHEDAVQERNVTVGTVKKSIAAITSRWFFRKTNQRLRASPLRPT